MCFFVESCFLVAFVFLLKITYDFLYVFLSSSNDEILALDTGLEFLDVDYEVLDV